MPYTKAYIKLIKRIHPKKIIAVNQGEALSLCLAKRFVSDFILVVCEHCNVTESIGDYKGWFGWYYRHFFQHEYNKYANVIHTVSFESKDDLVSNWGFPSEKVKVIYNPVMVDASLAQPKRNYKEDGRFVISAASRIEQQKRIDILLHGLSIAKSREPDLMRNVTVNIMGEGLLENEMKELAFRLSLTNMVNFKGFVKDPWRYVASSDMFVNTSEWEGLAVSIIEAQTVGTAVLASDCPSGNKELLLDGQAGCLFTRNDPEDFAEKLIQILQHKERLEEYVRVANNNLFRFDIDVIMKQYSEL